MNNWESAGQHLIARAISELSFEEILFPESLADIYAFTTKSGVRYDFQGKKNIWGNVTPNKSTLRRNYRPASDATQFFRDILSETGMSEFVLGQFFEELANSLTSDMMSSNLTNEELIKLNGDEIQRYLDGHPKILLNKGRMGWSFQDSEKYSPESGKSFRLHWMAVRDELLSGSGNPATLLLDTTLDIPQNFTAIPVHPWQWDNIIRIHYQHEIQSGDLISLGTLGDEYRAQMSIRTLSNVTRPGQPDVKLPLSILNTSCVRGLPEAGVVAGARLSAALKNIVSYDTKLSGAHVLTELAGLSFVNPRFKNMDAPYRLKETFGVVIRESALAYLSKEEAHLPTAALFHRDLNGTPFIKTLVEKSSLSVNDWLASYFQSVVLPLYHLQIEHGVGLVAHGQNIMMKLTKGVPSGVFLKDFQGDLRLREGVTLPDCEDIAITKLPANHLIHDLYTGHFVTVLRFVSPLVQESLNLEEKDFYQILRKCIQRYENELPSKPEASILRPKMERILLNKVRFSIGYGDSEVRPLPALGTVLTNPIGVNV